MSTSIQPPLSLSLFSLLRDELQDVNVISCSKATLVHISHMLEEAVLQHELPAMIFTGFQESSHWQKETQRYLRLSEVVKQICIFAGSPLPEEGNARQLHIELSGDDPLRQEWFLAILSNKFAVVLCGQDRAIPVKDEGLRLFDTIWTFEPSAINGVLDVLENVIERYRPAHVERLRTARQQYPLDKPDASLIIDFLIDMMRFEERLQASLYNQREQIEQTIAALSHAVYVLDTTPEGTQNTRFISPQVERMTGYPSSRFLSDDQFLLSIVPDESSRETLETFYDNLAQGGEASIRYQITRADGQMIWVQDSVRSIFDPHPELATYYGVLEDITDRVKAEELRREQERLRLELDKEREMSMLKSRFMYTVSHEFRTPLSTILSSSELLERYHDRMDDDRRVYHLDTIKDQVLHLRTVLEDIATIIGESGTERQFLPLPVNVRHIVQYIVSQHTANYPAIQFIYYGKPDLIVSADPRLLTNITVQLLTNAIHYSTTQETIIVTLTMSEDLIHLTIQDRGIGIPPQDLPHIFKPFHRGVNIGSTGGTGLGLKIVDDCVKLHNGTITVDSELNKGTTFDVKLKTQRY